MVPIWGCPAVRGRMSKRRKKTPSNREGTPRPGYKADPRSFLSRKDYRWQVLEEKYGLSMCIRYDRIIERSPEVTWRESGAKRHRTDECRYLACPAAL